MAVEDITRTPYPMPDAVVTEPRLGVLQSLRRHWLIAVLPVILLVGAAFAIGLQRKPVYTSEARLNVGGLNLTQQSLQGYVPAVTALSVAYARAIGATQVVDQTAARLHSSRGYVLDHISATSIQGSPVVRVIGTGSAATRARLLADAASDALVSYARALNLGKGDAKRLKKRFVRASSARQADLAKLVRMGPRNRRRPAIQNHMDAARLEMNVAGFLYQQSRVGESSSSLVQKLAPATRATSDRWSVIQDYAAGAAVAGILIGLGLAMARANAVARRRLGLR
jgi:hypothetical protein